MNAFSEYFYFIVNLIYILGEHKFQPRLKCLWLENRAIMNVETLIHMKNLLVIKSLISLS